ncbi:MAG: hypothetical protein DRP08_07185 [Candidatus Aenigmatarchaeota archaeon]|nr:MAG: hypothetical protein DRP08_07185 [Candidatus Aenigmarchaeota archaeon]
MIALDLNKELMKRCNEIFKGSEIPIKISQIYIYRPAFFDPAFDKIEPIHDVRRLLSCDTFCIDFIVNHEGRDVECEAKYAVEYDNVLISGIQLKYCDYFPNENPEDVVKKP